jgi:hypothetical protein
VNISGKVYGNAHITGGNNVFVATGAEVYEDAVLVGSVDILGKVHGNAKLTGGSGPQIFVGLGSEVYGNAVLTGTTLGSPQVFNGGAVYGDVTMIDHTEVYFGAIVRGKVFMSRFAQVFGATSTPGSGPVVDGAGAAVVARGTVAVVSTAPQVLTPTQHVVAAAPPTPVTTVNRAV